MKKTEKPAKPPKITEEMVSCARAAIGWKHGAINWTDREIRALIKAVLTEPPK